MTKSKEDAFTGVIAEAQGRTQQVVEKGTRLVQELSDIARGNAEAIVVSSKAAAAGLQTIGREAAELGQKNLQDATAAFQSLSTVKTPTDLLQIQAEFVRSAFSTWLEQSSKISDSLVELGGQIATPLADRYVAAVERVKVATLEK